MPDALRNQAEDLLFHGNEQEVLTGSFNELPDWSSHLLKIEDEV